MKNSIIGKVVNHVLYKKEELPKMLNDSKINVVIIPSLETFSNVLSEVGTAHIPVIVPNFMHKTYLFELNFTFSIKCRMDIIS